jgi:hypothetical protein
MSQADEPSSTHRPVFAGGAAVALADSVSVTLPTIYAHAEIYAYEGPEADLSIVLERQRIRAIRATIEAELERMIDLLDAIDGDPDLEPEEDADTGDLEPSLGWSVTGAHGRFDGSTFYLDVEDGHDGREPDEDFEDTDDNGIAEQAAGVTPSAWGAK